MTSYAILKEATKDVLHQNGGVKTKEEESRDSRMRDPVQEEDEGNFQTDVMGNSRKPAEE